MNRVVGCPLQNRLIGLEVEDVTIDSCLTTSTVIYRLLAQALKGVRTPDYEVLLGEEHLQQGWVWLYAYEITGGAIETAKKKMRERALVQRGRHIAVCLGVDLDP